MTRLGSILPAAALVGLVATASGCERGCATRWTRRAQTATASTAAFQPALDCPDGLAQCVGGVVEVSELARIPMPCSKTEGHGQCECPWKTVAECPHGCLADGTVIVAPADRATATLCLDPLHPRDAASLDEEAADE
jgi:hypothetical protein